MHRSSLVLACAALVAAAPLAAQQTTLPASSTKGFFVGAHLNGSSVTGDDFSDEDSESGPGVGIQLGFGFTRQLAVVLDGTGAGLDADGEIVGLGHFDVGLRYAFTGPTRRFVPFVEAAFTGRALEQRDVDLGDGETSDVTFSGTGVTLGGGAQYYFAPKWAVGAGLKWTTGEFDTVKVDNVSVSDLGIDAKTFRLNLGVTWYPMAGR